MLNSFQKKIKVANPVASLGKKVAIIEKDKLGGTCLNRGCIPSKMLIHPADVITTIEEEAVHRLKLDDNILQKYKPSEQQFMETVKYVAKVIDSECAAIQPEKKNPNITVFRGLSYFCQIIFAVFSSFFSIFRTRHFH